MHFQMCKVLGLRITECRFALGVRLILDTEILKLHLQSIYLFLEQCAIWHEAML